MAITRAQRRDILKLELNDFVDFEGDTDVTLEDLVDAVSEQVYNYKYTEALAADTLAETYVLGPFPQETQIESLILMPSAAVATDASDIATLTFKYGDSAAGARTALASWTNDSGASGTALAAGTKKELLSAPVTFPADTNITLTVTKGASGKLVNVNIVAKLS